LLIGKYQQNNNRGCLIKRRINLDCMHLDDSYVSGKVIKQELSFKEGIDKMDAKKLPVL